MAFSGAPAPWPHCPTSLAPKVRTSPESATAAEKASPAATCTNFGYDVQVCYPKRTPKPIYEGLVTQLETLGVEFLQVDDVKSEALVVTHDVVVDALFGFSFRGEPRHPFDELLEILNPHSAPPPIVAVDVPSGWSVDEGDVSGEGIRPDLLVSLTAPKLGAKTFTGPHHFVGGRFVPPTLASEFGLRLPAYEGRAQCARVGGSGGFSFGGGAARRRRGIGGRGARRRLRRETAGILGQQLGRIRRGIDRARGEARDERTRRRGQCLNDGE